jgi:hypothetical protein
VTRALEHAAARNVVVELEQQDDRQRTFDLVEHGVERLGLNEITWVAIENESILAPLDDLALDDRDRDVVWNKLSITEIRLDEPAELRAPRDVFPVQIAGRNVWDAVLLRDALRLRPLPRPLRADDEDVQRRNPS